MSIPDHCLAFSLHHLYPPNQILKTLYHLIPFIAIYLYPLLGKCLFPRHYIISTPPFQSICTPSLVNDDFQDIFQIYLSIPIYMCSHPPPTHLLDKSLFSRHYIASIPPFQYTCTLFGKVLFSTLYHHSYLHVPSLG